VHFSDVLKDTRERAGLSKAALAAATGVSYKHIANLENRSRPITLDILHKLDSRLHFPLRTLGAIIRTPQHTMHALSKLSAVLLAWLCA
jgi:transcriptional regulator with XRE-family HTH domain